MLNNLIIRVTSTIDAVIIKHIITKYLLLYQFLNS